MSHVTIFTDGCCRGNPGPGGWAAILTNGQHTKEISGGVKLTTNNWMEVKACIKGLEALQVSCRVTVFSDSKYVVDSVNKGWAKKWRANQWMRNNKDRAQNIDLWERLFELLKIHDVSFCWVKGHHGHPMNERCDFMAQNAARGRNLEVDHGYPHDISHFW